MVWDRISDLSIISLLSLSTLKHVKCYPTMTKAYGLGLGSEIWAFPTVGVPLFWGSYYEGYNILGI